MDLDLATVPSLSTAGRRLGALGGATGRLVNPWLLAPRRSFLRQADAVRDLGKPEEIGRVFTGFQKYLYVGPAAA